MEDLTARVADLRDEATRAAGEAAATASHASALSAQLDERTAELEAASLRVEDLVGQARTQAGGPMLASCCFGGLFWAVWARSGDVRLQNHAQSADQQLSLVGACTITGAVLLLSCT